MPGARSINATHSARAWAALGFEAGFAENFDGLVSEQKSPDALNTNVCCGARNSSAMFGERSARLKPPRKRTKSFASQLASAFHVVLLPVVV